MIFSFNERSSEKKTIKQLVLNLKFEYDAIKKRKSYYDHDNGDDDHYDEV